VDECKPLPVSSSALAARTRRTAWLASEQGITLVHFSAQLKRCVWDRGCIQGLFRGCLGVSGGIGEYVGCILCQKRLRLS